MAPLVTPGVHCDNVAKPNKPYSCRTNQPTAPTTVSLCHVRKSPSTARPNTCSCYRNTGYIPHTRRIGVSRTHFTHHRHLVLERRNLSSQCPVPVYTSARACQSKRLFTQACASDRFVYLNTCVKYSAERCLFAPTGFHKHGSCCR